MKEQQHTMLDEEPQDGTEEWRQTVLGGGLTNLKISASRVLAFTTSLLFLLLLVVFVKEDLSPDQLLRPRDIFDREHHPSQTEESVAQRFTEPLEIKPNTVIVASGGSATAGGGCPGKKEHYVQHLGDLFNVTVVNSGHGSRNTLDAAFLFDAYIPKDVDLIVWEFAINDSAHGARDVAGHLFAIQFYIQQVRLHPNKPKLFMLYLWDTPFQDVGSGESDAWNNKWARQTSFSYIADYVRHTDVFAGEFNFAQWMHEKLGDSKEAGDEASKLYLYDQHHPNCYGNKVLAEEMARAMQTYHRQVVTHTSKDPLEWPCGTGDREAALLRGKVFHRLPTERIFSWTAETPHPSNSTIVLSNNTAQLKFKKLGKFTPGRVDQKLCLIVPPCPDALVFHVKEKKKARALHFLGASSLHITFEPHVKSTYVDSKTFKKDCVLNMFHHGRLGRFHVFDEPTEISNIRICGVGDIINLALL